MEYLSLEKYPVFLYNESMKNRVYLCIDLKSFFASVECVSRGLDPMCTNLVVADPERGDKTICLAVTPAMKALGVRNRCRVFEIPKHISYITASPRMKLYIDYAAKIYGIYLRYVSKEDIHVYSIDEVFMDVTGYLSLYGKTPREMAVMLMGEVLRETGIRATCGIGTNLYLAKIALDITAKHATDFIGELTVESYRETLWNHRPLTDFWRIGPGTARRLESLCIYTMGDVAHTSEDLLYRHFGIDAELLIDHAWGLEPTTIADIHGYRSKTNCLTSGQVLMRDYTAEEGVLIVKEMMDLLCLEMVDRGVVTQSVTLQVGYSSAWDRAFVKGTASVSRATHSDTVWVKEIEDLYRKIVHPEAQVRRMSITCNKIEEPGSVQYTLFEDPVEEEQHDRLQKTVVGLRKRFGKNAVVKGMNLEEHGTTIERNRQIGGHKSGE